MFETEDAGVGESGEGGGGGAEGAGTGETWVGGWVSRWVGRRNKEEEGVV